VSRVVRLYAVYGDLTFTVAATFKSRQAQSEDCRYGFIENALKPRTAAP